MEGVESEEKEDIERWGAWEGVGGKEKGGGVKQL